MDTDFLFFFESLHHMQVDSKPDTAIANHPEFITAHFATYTLTHPPCSIQCIVCCMQCYQTPPQGKYVFVSVAGKYSPQVDHVLDSTFIHRCPFVCLCLWHRCRLILLPPTRLQATFRAVLTILHFHRFQSFIHVSQSLAECISVLFHPLASPVIPLIRFCLFVISFSLSFAFTASLSLSPFSVPKSSFLVSLLSSPQIRLRPLLHSIWYWLVSLCVLWPCCNSAREVKADRFLWKRHCHVQ